MANSFWTLLGTLPAILASRPRRQSPGASPVLENLNDTQLADLGIQRDSAGRYSRPREPALLDVLFPRNGEASGGGHAQMNRPQPWRGPTRRETVE